MSAHSGSVPSCQINIDDASVPSAAKPSVLTTRLWNNLVNHQMYIVSANLDR
jgi:hypothetical protein